MRQRVMQKVTAARRERIAAAQAQAQARMDAAFAVPEIDAAHRAYTEASFAALDGAGAGAKEREAAAHKAYADALKKHGFSEKDFAAVPSCPICGDRGSVNGKMCRCVRAEYIRTLKEECDIVRRAPFTFADADAEQVSDAAQQKELATLYSVMKSFAAKYPRTNYKNFVLTGATGTGKSSLAYATARAFTDRGYAALVVSAYEFNAAMLKAHTSPVAERGHILGDFFTADLLVIDDLGTEPMLRNVTVEYMLLVIEERTAKGLATIFTTNYSADRLLNRYGERIYSRLADKRKSLITEIHGKDLRLS